ncbi:PKD domain-containing protein [Carboxylicivirga sp. N1Y90]|uniref:PKD domain-containing protein n=1 Tax=Carboxylicivirga fragile TaxID=3417571 RepID=UPI003D33F38F|nr:PKD domain-containing protein [Marinilabiliaceae bacterium N1Y90]
MKKISYIALLFVAILAFSCSPEVDLREQPSTLPGVDFSVDATDPNQPILTINDNTVFNANWYFEDGTMLQGKSVQCFYPLEGDYAFTITAMNGKGQAEGAGSVNVPESNPDMVFGIPEYVALCGEKEDNGKYWVWAQDEPGGDVSYMTADYDWSEFWWNPYAGDAGADLPGLLNEIKFDLVGGFNMTRFETKGVPAESGSFSLNLDAMTLQLNGVNIPNYDDENLDPNVTATGLYKIQVLNDYELLLWQDHGPNNGGAHDYAWAWKFKARDLVPLDDPLFKLAGEKGEGGRTWTFDNDGQSLGACYMTADYNWEEAWWSPYSTLESIPEYDHTIKFDLDYNYIRYDGTGAEIEVGTYTFNSKSGELQLTDGFVPNHEVRNPDEDAESNIDLNVAATGKYIVQSVDDDQLFIWQDHGPNNGGAMDYGWAWIFKQAE